MRLSSRACRRDRRSVRFHRVLGTARRSKCLRDSRRARCCVRSERLTSRGRPHRHACRSTRLVRARHETSARMGGELRSRMSGRAIVSLLHFSSGKLVVVSFDAVRNGKAYWRCACECFGGPLPERGPCREYNHRECKTCGGCWRHGACTCCPDIAEFRK